MRNASLFILFDAMVFRPWPVPTRAWDVSPDGTRFRVAQARRGVQINALTSWFEELNAKVPRAR